MRIRLTEIKALIKEEVYKHQINQLDENILRSLWTLILTPKVKKIADQYKNQPEYKELEAQIKQSAANLEMTADRLRDAMAKKQALIAKMKDEGLKVHPGMSVAELIAKLPNVSEKEIQQLSKKYRN